MKDKLLDGIKDRLESYEGPVPDGLWDSIETSVMTRKEKPGRAILPWVWSLAAACVAAIGVFIGVRFSDSGMDRGGAVSIATAPQDDSKESRTPSYINPSSSADRKAGPASSRNNANECPVRGGGGAFLPDAPVFSEESTARPAEGGGEVPQGDVRHPDAVPPTSPDIGTGMEWERYLGQLASEEHSRRKRKITAGLSVTGFATSSGNMKTVNSSMFYMGGSTLPSADLGGGPKGANDNKMETRAFGPATRAETNAVTSDSRHRRPIQASASLSYPLDDTFGVESGLTYSLLQSTFTTTSGATVSEDVQTLGFIGIPLNLKVNLVSGKRFAIYASGGGMAQKCVKGDVRTTVAVNGVQQSKSDGKSLTIKPILWSLGASAGVQANLAAHFGLYAEPGVSYHFKDDTGIRSIYSERPFDFVMTFGARFTIR